MNFDIIFPAVSGYSLEIGFTCGIEVENTRHRTTINHSSKVGVTFTVTYALWEDVDIVVSDNELPPAIVENF